MKIESIAATKDDLKKKVLPLLLNEVFHVTNGEAFRKIQESGSVNSNRNNTYPSVFSQSNNNFGARAGMVCLIDLRQRSYSDAEKLSGDGYYFLRPKDWEEVVFLFLNSPFYSNLKLQERFDPVLIGENYVSMEAIKKGTYLPEIECWYPEKISLDKISRVLIVNIVDTQLYER